MGYERHDAIVVTSMFGADLKAAHAVARRFLNGSAAYVSEITPETVNGYRSFLVAPDGSKEGWTDSDEAEQARELFIAWLDTDSGPCVDWVAVNFGGDDSDVIRVRSDLEPAWATAKFDQEGEQGG